MTPAAVIFDCDGVVVDSEHPTLVMVRDDLERYGLTLTLAELEAGEADYEVGDSRKLYLETVAKLRQLRIVLYIRHQQHKFIPT